MFKKKSKKQRKKSSALELRQKEKKARKKQLRIKRPSIKYSASLPDLNLIFLVALLFIGGLLMIFSASATIAYTKHAGNTFYYFEKQIQWIILGSLAGVFFYFIPIVLLKKLSVFMLAFNIILLLYILPEAIFGKSVIDEYGNIRESGLQMPLVNAINGATRWINLGSFSLQPSEFIKFTLTIYLSAWLSRDFKIDKKDPVMDHFKKVLAPFIVLSGAISILILAQRDFDTTVIIFLSVFMVYYMSGNDRVHSLGSAAMLAVSGLLGTLAMALEPYRRQRVISFFDILFNGSATEDNAKAAGFQVWNGLVAIGSGGLFGLGYGESRQKQGFLQDAAFTDSIFVVIGEEFGMIGVLLIIASFLYFASLGLKIAKNADSTFETLLAIGMTSWIVIQGFLNIAANLAVIPFGGMPLPFFSYGGSSTLVTIMSIAVLLNISRHKKVNSRQSFN